MSAIDASSTGHPTLAVVGSLDFGVGSRLVDVSASSVLTARCGLAHHLGMTVTIEVIDEILGVVCSSSDVSSQIDTPQLSAVKFVAVDNHVSRDTALRIVLGVGRVPFYEEFILSVAIHVAHTHVIGRVGIGSSVESAASRTVEFQRQIDLLPRRDSLRCIDRHTIHLGHHLV